MAYNLGSASSGYNLGYTGAYTGGTQYPYELTSHGAADPNSIMADANFATTGTVEIGVVSDFDPAKLIVDWEAISDGQLWREDINTLDAVTVTATADTTDTATLRYRVVETDETGEFTVTANLEEDAADTTPAAFTVTPLDSQALDTLVEFAPIEVEDIDPGESIAVVVTGTDVEYAVDTGSGYGAFTATSTDVSLGDLVKARIRTSDDFSEAVTGTLAIGSESSSLSATTRAAIPPVISVGALTTTNDTPVVAGTSGTATSLTLVVDGETYNPTPAGGSWSQQLPTLAIGSYIMELNGEDDDGTPAEEAEALLRILDPSASTYPRKSNRQKMLDGLAGGGTGRHINSIEISFWNANGADTNQYNHAKRQYEENL